MKDTVNIPELNSKIVASLKANETQKVASAGSDYTRLHIREESFTNKILPFKQATPDMYVPSLDHDKKQIFEELEPDSPGAKWVPTQTVPEGEYISGSRYVIPLGRIITPRLQKDIGELETYKMDLRKVLSDNLVKDGVKQIDGAFIATVESILSDSTDNAGKLIQNQTGKEQVKALSGGLTRDNLVEAKKVMMRGSTFPGFEDKFALRSHIALMNDITAQDMLKFRRDEAGGDLAEQMLKDGLVLDKIMGLKTIYTMKRSLVPDNTVYFFAAPEFLGKAYYAHDWTMYMKQEAWNIDMFAYWEGGMAIGNIAGVCKVTFDA